MNREPANRVLVSGKQSLTGKVDFISFKKLRVRLIEGERQ